MPDRIALAIAATALFAATAIAQTAIWTPNGYAAVAGNFGNSLPWNRGTGVSHYQQIYGAANFAGQGITMPVLISRLRFRTAVTATSWTGGSWPNVVLAMSTAANPYTAAANLFAANHGPDLATVYSGRVTVLPGTGSNPGPVYIDIPLATIFLYDPAAGDLCFEVLLDGAGWTGGSAQCDAVAGTGAGGPAQVTLIYETNNTASTWGTVMVNYGIVTEFTCVPTTGHAYTQPFGTGCYDVARSGLRSSPSHHDFDCGAVAQARSRIGICTSK